MEDKHLVAFDWMCLKLDNGQRRDYEWLASQYEKMSFGVR